MEIFRSSQGASVLKAVTESEEMESIVQEDMEEGDTVISGKLLGQVIEDGRIKPQFKKYEQAMSLADSEISNILENDRTVDSSLKILQRTVNSFRQQYRRRGTYGAGMWIADSRAAELKYFYLLLHP